MADHQSSSAMTIKLGIWCDYGVTLEPTEGIGVFVANLVQGLVQQPEIAKIVLVSKEKQEHLLATLKSLDPMRIEIIGNRKPPFYLRKPWKLLRKIDRRAHKQRGEGLSPSSLSGILYHWFSHQIDRSKADWINRVDVWLLPYVGLDQQFTKPTVVIVHDLVTYHFSDGISPEKLGSFKRLVDQVTDQASIVACMSNFILQNDLRGTLGLPEQKTRMIRPAVPRDFFRSQQATAQLPSELLSKNYLLYPAAFRSYKNHALLLQALPLLNRDRPKAFHVVFTGITQIPEYLQTLIENLNIHDQVHVLGKVTRGELELLYRNAYATAVPSLYEQGSFPLYESLSFECPILASDIPALREQLQALGNDAIFFDPHSAESFARSVLQIEQNRQGIISRQLAGFERMKQRSWDDAAKEWCDVFQQAIDIQRDSQS